MAKRKKFTIILLEENASATSVLTLGKSVSTNMGLNATTFPTPPVALTALDTALEELEEADVPEDNRSNMTDLNLKNKKLIVLAMLSTLAGYVLMIANGNRNKASLSGFTLSAEDTVDHPPGEFELKSRKAGADEGTVEIRLNHRAGNAVFIVQLKVGDEWVIIDAFNTITFVVKGLPSGTSYLRIYGKKGDKKSPAIEVTVKAF